MSCTPETVRNVLKANNIKPRGRSKKVDQYDLAGNFVQTFDSVARAVEWLHEFNITQNKKASTYIYKCCRHEREEAYGYMWEFNHDSKY